MRRYRVGLLLLTLGLFALAGCSSDSNTPEVAQRQEEKLSVVDAIIAEEAKKLEEKTVATETEATAEVTTEPDQESNPIQPIVEEDAPDIQLDGEIIDLTQMNSNMVYVVMNQMNMNPSEYVGKTVILQGNFDTLFDEGTQKQYHYALMTDETACCSVGLEFVWDDGNHVYPDEYPEPGEMIKVTGQFETYMDEGVNFLYCRLSNATLEIVPK